MIGEPGTAGYTRSHEDKDSPQMSLFEDGDDARP